MPENELFSASVGRKWRKKVMSLEGMTEEREPRQGKEGYHVSLTKCEVLTNSKKF